MNLFNQQLNHPRKTRKPRKPRKLWKPRHLRNRLGHADRGERAGFSLIEVLFSIFILGIGLISVAAMMPAAVYQAREAANDVQGTVFGQNVIAALQLQYDHVREVDASPVDRAGFLDAFPPSAGSAFELPDLPNNPYTTDGNPLDRAALGEVFFDETGTYFYRILYRRATVSSPIEVYVFVFRQPEWLGPTGPVTDAWQRQFDAGVQEITITDNRSELNAFVQSANDPDNPGMFEIELDNNGFPDILRNRNSLFLFVDTTTGSHTIGQVSRYGIDSTSTDRTEQYAFITPAPPTERGRVVYFTGPSGSPFADEPLRAVAIVRGVIR